MEKKTFDELSDIRKGQILKHEATFITDRIYKCFKILLFQCNQFYVEVYFHTALKTIQHIRSFDTDEELDPYVTSIDISRLYQQL